MLINQYIWGYKNTDGIYKDASSCCQIHIYIYVNVYVCLPLQLTIPPSLLRFQYKAVCDSNLLQTSGRVYLMYTLTSQHATVVWGKRQRMFISVLSRTQVPRRQCHGPGEYWTQTHTGISFQLNSPGLAEHGSLCHISKASLS